MSIGQEFWVVATEASKTDFESKLKGNSYTSDASKFAVAEGGKQIACGSFDVLVALTDDLAKADQLLDGIVHRIERQYMELDPSANFVINSQRGDLKLADYVKNWHWDEAKYPKDRAVADNLKFLMSVASKTDEEVRTKLGQFSDSKTQRSNIAKKEAATLATRDLVDVLTPHTVQMSKSGAASTDDFISTAHLATICVILTRGADKDFLPKYESFGEHVVPGSAKHFKELDDKDGNMLWRVVVFKAGVDSFKKACREHRFVPRDFEYSQEAYEKLLKQRDSLEEQCAQQCQKLKGICQAAWSDSMVAWMHIKAMRVVVECTLRFGNSAQVCAYVLSPANPIKARLALADILGRSDESESKALADAAAEDGEEYFPYVSFSFTPMAAPTK